jgi:cytochrome c oxidase subunit 2
MASFLTSNPVLDPASPQARALLSLFVSTSIVCLIILVLVTVLIVRFITRYRKKDDVEPEQVAGNTKLEIAWTVGPALVLVFLFVLMVRAMRISDPPVNRAPDVTVVGHQWWWEIRYPNGMITANEMHIPTNTDILVRVEATDVIHSYWVPRLGRKMDAVPGHPNYVWIRADNPGNYVGACSEYCGTQHAWMRTLVVAQKPEAYREWYDHQARPAKMPVTASELRGEEIFHSKTCIACHQIRDLALTNQAGPDLTHFASRQQIGTGVLPNNAESVRAWLADPQHYKPGILMPNFHFNDKELDDLTAYLETLK